MHAVARFLLAAGTLLLSSYESRRPDVILSVQSPDESRSATLRGFEPRGTVEPYLVVSFAYRNSVYGAATFRQLHDAEVGWLAPNIFVVVGNDLKFNEVSSEYFPDGTVASKTELVICDASILDCSELRKKISGGSKSKRLGDFPSVVKSSQT